MTTLIFPRNRPIARQSQPEMNGTIKLTDHIYRDARHRAVDAGRSLSGWIAMANEGLTEALTADRPFEQAGFKTLLA